MIILKRSYRIGSPIENYETFEGPRQSFFEQRDDHRRYKKEMYEQNRDKLSKNPSYYKNKRFTGSSKFILKLWESYARYRVRKRNSSKFNLQKYKTIRMSWKHSHICTDLAILRINKKPTLEQLLEWEKL